MGVVKDEAVCIRRRSYSETSQIVTLLGRESGKVQAIAKGAKRVKGGFSGGVEPLTAGEVLFVPAQGDGTLATLTRWDLVEGYDGLRRSLVGLHCGQYAAELLAEFLEEYDPHPGLYERFREALGAWEAGERAGAVLLYFEVALLREVGLAGEFGRCVACGGEVAAGRQAYFSSQMGGMLCDRCEGAVAQKRTVGAAALALLRRPGEAGTTSEGAVLDAHEVLSYHERELLGKETRTMGFVNRLLRQHRSQRR